MGPSAASLANDVRSLPEYPEVALLRCKSKNEINAEIALEDVNIRSKFKLTLQVKTAHFDSVDSHVFPEGSSTV